MKLIFNLDYHTTFGESLVLNIMGTEGKVQQHMSSYYKGEQA